MGLFSGIGNLVGKAVSGITKAVSTVAPLTSFVPGPIGTFSRAFTTGAGAFGSTPGIAPNSFIGSALPARLPLPFPRGGGGGGALPLPRITPRRAPSHPLVATADGCPPGYHLDKKTRSYCVRNRRMNPLNHKANMRAARRLIAFRKAVVKTEKALRRAVPPAARRRAPSGHRARLSHT